MGGAPPKEGDGVGRIRKTKHLMVLRGLFPSLPMKKVHKPNLLILMVFLVAWGSKGGIRGDGWVMYHPSFVTG